jgi:hypothetical protein
MLFTAYPKNSVTMAVEPLSVMLFLVDCAVDIFPKGFFVFWDGETIWLAGASSVLG